MSSYTDVDQFIDSKDYESLSILIDLYKDWKRYQLWKKNQREKSAFGRMHTKTTNRKRNLPGARSLYRRQIQDTRYKQLCDRSANQDNYWSEPVTKQTTNWRQYRSETITHLDGRIGTISFPKEGDILSSDLFIRTGVPCSYSNAVRIKHVPIDFDSFFKLADNIVDNKSEPGLVLKILNSGPQAGSLPDVDRFNILIPRGKRTGRVRAPRLRRHQRLKWGKLKYTGRSYHFLEPDLTRMQYSLKSMLV